MLSGRHQKALSSILHKLYVLWVEALSNTADQSAAQRSEQTHLFTEISSGNEPKTRAPKMAHTLLIPSAVIGGGQGANNLI